MCVASYQTHQDHLKKYFWKKIVNIISLSDENIYSDNNNNNNDNEMLQRSIFFSGKRLSFQDPEKKSLFHRKLVCTVRQFQCWENIILFYLYFYFYHKIFFRLHHSSLPLDCCCYLFFQYIEAIMVILFSLYKFPFVFFLKTFTDSIVVSKFW